MLDPLPILLSLWIFTIFLDLAGAVEHSWGMTIVDTDKFVDEFDEFVFRLTDGVESCNVMITDFAQGTMAFLLGLLIIHRAGVARLSAAAGNVVSLLSRMSFQYELVLAADGVLRGVTFTSWAEPADAVEWASHLVRLALFAVRLKESLLPLLAVARGLEAPLALEAGGPLNFDDLRGEGGRPDPTNLEGVGLDPDGLRASAENSARAERAVRGEFDLQQPSATGKHPIEVRELC
jgi:hypothetical protein